MIPRFMLTALLLAALLLAGLAGLHLLSAK